MPFCAIRRPTPLLRWSTRCLPRPATANAGGRYWLDIARYSDDKLNSTEEEPYKNSFRYRDWVIGAFNSDMPYDQFVRAQDRGRSASG